MSNTGYFQYNLRSQIHCAPGSIIRLPALFEGLGAKRVVILTDPGIRSVGIIDRIERIFNNMSGGNLPKLVGVYDQITPNSGFESVDKALEFARSCGADSVLSVGGGSSLDAAKGVKYALHENARSLHELFQGSIKFDTWPEADPISIPHIAIPTTAGTGAEVSTIAVFLNEELNVKVNLINPYLDADIALLDPELTLGLPPRITASTGLDALTHAIEAVVSPKANHFTDAYAFRAAQMIVKNLPVCVEDGKNLVARTAQLQASSMAINAFGQSMGLIPIHNCAHALGAMYMIPHGDANAILLPVVIKALPHIYRPQAHRLAEALSIDARDLSDEACLEQVIETLKALQTKLGIESNFAHWKVKKEDAAKIKQAILQDGASAFYSIPDEALNEIIENVAV